MEWGECLEKEEAVGEEADRVGSGGKWVGGWVGGFCMYSVVCRETEGGVRW